MSRANGGLIIRLTIVTCTKHINSLQVFKCCQLEPKVIIIASCFLVPVIVTAVGATVIIVVVVVVFHIVVAPWTEYQRARLKIEGN